MSNFNNFKTSNGAYFPQPAPGKPSLKLDQVSNVWDDMIDQLAGLHAAIQPTDQTSSNPVAIDVGPSPFEYIAGTEPEQIHISDGGGTVSGIYGYSEADDEWKLLTTSQGGSFMRWAGSQLRIVYSGPPPIVMKDVGNFNNAAGITEVLTPSASPYTINAAGRTVVVYISDGGGTIYSVKRNSIALGSVSTAMIPRGGALVVEYGGPPPYIVRES